MPYTVSLISLDPSTATCRYVGRSGFPVTFDYLLCSFWGCLAGVPGNGVTLQNNGWGHVTVGSSGTQVTIVPSGTSAAIFNGTFAYTPTNVLTHLVMSVSPADNVLQLYANDVPLTLTTGGWTGTGTFNLGPVSLWVVQGSGAAGPGMADVFAAAPDTFFDLSVTANRRKFINSDLKPVDLGSDASSVLGDPPPVYLTGRSGVANDFAANNGVGGAWEILDPPLGFQAPGSCVAATVPPKLVMDNLLVSGGRPRTSELIFLDWSNDRGHTYGNPVGQPIGARGAYLTSVQWQRLEYARDRVYRLTWSVPVATALQGAWIDADTKAKS